jgi:hypothetical protein
LPAEATTGDISQVPKDFKLPPLGSRDWVAGQPADEAELEKTMAEAKKRKEEGHAGQKALTESFATKPAQVPPHPPAQQR